MKELKEIAREFVTSYFNIRNDFFDTAWDFVNVNFDRISSVATSAEGMKTIGGPLSFGGREEQRSVKAILIFADGFREMPLKGDFSDLVDSVKGACTKYKAEAKLTEEILKKVTSLENRITKFMKPQGKAKTVAKDTGKVDYDVYLSNEEGIGTESLEAEKSKVDKVYLVGRENYDIFVYTRSVYAKKKNEKTRNCKLVFVELDQRMYVLLILFLRYKDSSLNVFALHKKAWDHVPKDYAGRPDYKKTMEYLKSTISELKSKIGVYALEIKKPRNSEGYTCSGNFKFCVIIDKSQSDKYILSDFDIKDAD